MSQDRFIQEAEQAELDSRRAQRAANLFDVRRFIAGLFLIYGVILLVLGLGASDADVEQAAGVNVNLWTGLAMLIVAAIFIAWAVLRPLADQLDEGPGEDDRTVKGAPAPVGADAAALRGSTTTSRRAGRNPGGAGGGSAPGSKQA